MFRPFMTSIAKLLLERPDLGMIKRVGLGAVLSVLDMTSDAYMVSQFFEQGNTSVARATLGMITTNLFLQVILVYAQNKKKTLRVLLMECLYVLLCIKPGIDALRVMQGGDQDPLLAMDCMTEMLISKSIEMAVESLPGSVLQTIILLSLKTRTPAAFVSIALSAASTAYTATTMSYDIDTSVMKRRQSPKLYGYIPGQGRALVFFLMFMLSLLQLLAKVFSTALLVMTNPLWLAIWLGADYALYIAYKIARRDFVYFVPMAGTLKYTLAFLGRIFVKMLVDFSGVLMMRGPYGKTIFHLRIRFRRRTADIHRHTFDFFTTFQSWEARISPSIWWRAKPAAGSRPTCISPTTTTIATHRQYQSQRFFPSSEFSLVSGSPARFCSSTRSTERTGRRSTRGSRDDRTRCRTSWRTTTTRRRA